MKRSSAIVLVLGLVLSAAACDFHYRAAVIPAEDEVMVQVVQGSDAEYDHPVQVSPSELKSILQGVRVEFKSHWLQKMITGPLDSQPLFNPPVLARLTPVLSEAFAKLRPNERIVFYVAERRASDRRDVTSGTIFVEAQQLAIMVVNHQNRVDVIPGLLAYDRTSPEVAVAPQRFSLAFQKPEFVTTPKSGFVAGAFGPNVPTLTVDYRHFLQSVPRAEAAPGYSWTPGTPTP